MLVLVDPSSSHLRAGRGVYFGCFEGVWQGPWGCFGAWVGLGARGVSLGLAPITACRSTAERRDGWMCDEPPCSLQELKFGLLLLPHCVASYRGHQVGQESWPSDQLPGGTPTTGAAPGISEVCEVRQRWFHEPRNLPARCELGFPDAAFREYAYRRLR